uniref:Uncharacterized protein n=1 Tax=Avena sativa TaxID=4498 RepID=A0ACD6AM17_AVESA
MAGARRNKLPLLCYLLLVATLIIEGDVLAARPFSPSILETEKQGLVRSEEGPPAATSWPPTAMTERSWIMRRGLVGSRAPTCTYNECRGCRYRCSAHGIPVDASDPMNSAYHYRCFCHI